MNNLTTFLFAILLISNIGYSDAVKASPSQEEIAEAARALIHRVAPSIEDDFELQMIPKVEGKDVYELESVDEKIVLRGNDGISLARALQTCFYVCLIMKKTRVFSKDLTLLNNSYLQ